MHACTQDKKGNRTWSNLAASGLCLATGPETNTIAVCRYCRRKSTQAVWARCHGTECQTCQSFFKFTVKDPMERAETKTRVATELKDNKKFEDWKENSWQPYFNLAADGKASRTCVRREGLYRV